MIDMESSDPIKQKRVGYANSKKQDQSAQWSYYSIPKILSTITSFFIPINMTSRIKERWRTRIKKQES